mmetsp:Transcript_10836/g.26763  ORF Transcript_10836/g.26763 Transcript_10836/m.26763 type:complete len:227 (-) Transcript_10836:104-784(-)
MPGSDHRREGEEEEVSYSPIIIIREGTITILTLPILIIRCNNTRRTAPRIGSTARSCLPCPRRLRRRPPPPLRRTAVKTDPPHRLPPGRFSCPPRPATRVARVVVAWRQGILTSWVDILPLRTAIRQHPPPLPLLDHRVRIRIRDTTPPSEAPRGGSSGIIRRRPYSLQRDPARPRRTLPACSDPTLPTTATTPRHHPRHRRPSIIGRRTPRRRRRPRPPRPASPS